MIRIVFIGNDKKCFSILKMSISNIKVSLLPFGAESLSVIQRVGPDIILLDMDLQNVDWSQFIRQLQNMNKFTSILITGTFYSPENIIQAIKMGVCDYIPKPYTPDNLKMLEKAIDAIISKCLDRKRNCPGADNNILNGIVGCSGQIQNVKELLIPYAESGAAILLLGESGVGKNLIARKIHELSKRKNYVYKTMHTAALTPTLIESELYGTNEGAFTDAKSRPGYFESANRGTLFLDEIGEMPLESQVKLLRILEEKTISRVGGIRQIPIDVRVVSATNINIVNAVQTGSFREDLYYRINTLTITIPPLRQRREDIPLLVDSFLKEQGPASTIDNSGLEKLISYHWPGNIRELKSVLTRARIHSGMKSLIRADHITFC